TEKGPRQRIILHLGTLDLSKLELKKLARILEARLLGQLTLFEQEDKLAKIADEAFANMDFREKKLVEDAEKPSGTMELVDLDSLSLMNTRSAGPEAVGFGISKKLGFREILRKSGLTKHQALLVETIVLARLIHPGSERETLDWLMNHSTLLELLFPEGKAPGRNAIYEIADKLLQHKDAIETGLRKSEWGLFSSQATLFLYDLTNTYFEGRASKNELARFGHSKEKRSDCRLVTLALLIDNLGFPIFSQIYPGNQSEPETLEGVLNRLEKDLDSVSPGFRPIIAMDRGIATAANIKLLRERNLGFVVVERKNAVKTFAAEFESPSGFETVKTPSGEIQLKKIESDDSASVLVISEGRKRKESAINAQKEERFRKDVEKLNKSIGKKSVCLPEKVGRRIGRILERYPSMSRFFTIATENTEDEKIVTSVSIKPREVSEKDKESTGYYVIETSQKDLPAKEIWELYKTLHRVEHAFRCLKTDLGFRPVHHQLATRTQSHLFISVLAYHFLITIENLLHNAGEHRSWSTIRSCLSTVRRGTITCADANKVSHQIRVTENMTPDSKKILQTLGITSPFKRHHNRIQVRL
ncbi:MAG: transposase, partial [Firmicutes bacterium HGW-Firmicutes-8]